MVDLIPGLPNDMAMQCLLRLHFESIPNAIFVCKNWMHEIRSCDYLRRRIVGGHNQSVFVMLVCSRFPILQGEYISCRLRVFELKTGNWSMLPPIPGLCLIEILPFELIVVGLNLVLIVGSLPHLSVATHRVYIYNFISNMWRRGADMPDARIFFRCVPDSDRVVYVFGGRYWRGWPPAMSALAYDVAKDKWVQLPDMKIFHDHDAVFPSGKLRVFGNYTFNHELCVLNAETQALVLFTWKWGPPSEILYFNVSGMREIVTTQTRHDVLENGECEKVAHLPDGIGDNIDCMMMWNKHLVVMGYADTIHKESGRICMLDLESKEWSVFHMPWDYSFLVKRACCLEI